MGKPRGVCRAIRLLTGRIMPNKEKRHTGQDSAIGIIGRGWVKAAARAHAFRSAKWNENKRGEAALCSLSATPKGCACVRARESYAEVRRSSLRLPYGTRKGRKRGMHYTLAPTVPADFSKALQCGSLLKELPPAASRRTLVSPHVGRRRGFQFLSNISHLH